MPSWSPIVKARTWVAVCAVGEASVTWVPSKKAPASVGVPMREPSRESARPCGKVPDVIVQE
jgi:hypothetical protein